MASLALTIAGNALGGPVGAAVGGLLGSYIDNTFLIDQFVDRPKIKPPSVGELSIQGVEEGAPSSFPIGAASPVVGNVIWSSDFITEKVEEEVGGKGGGEKVTTGYNVYVHLAVLVSHNEISSIKKIFADGQLLYDSSPDKAVSSSLISIAKDSNLEMDINSPAGGPDLSVFRSGINLSVSGFTNTANNGDFKVVSSKKTISGASRVRIRNSLGTAAAAGPLIALYQDIPEYNAEKVQQITIYAGTSSQDPDPLIESFEGDGEVPAWRGMCYVVFKKLLLGDYGNRIPQFRFIVDEAGSDMTAGDAIQKIMARAKESGAEVLTSEATRVLRGYPIRGLVPTAQALQPLQIALNVLDQETDDGKIRFFDREKATIIDVPEALLGAIESGSTHKGTIEAIPEPRRQAPSEVHVGYLDIEADYQHGDQHQNRPLAHFLSEKLDFPLVLEGAGGEARALSRVILWLREFERKRFKLALPPSFIAALENDVIRVPVHGRVETLLIERVDIGDNFMLELECTLDRRDVLIQEAVADPPSAGGIEVETPANIVAIPIDGSFGGVPTPGPGPGVPVGGPPTTGGGSTRPGYGLAIYRTDDEDEWEGGVIFENTAGTGYTRIATITREAKGGRCKSVLGSASGGVWDEKNTLTVEMLSGTLESHSEDEVLSGFNRAFIGREVIGFRSAVLSETVPNTYTLSGLLRGLRDTTNYIGTHGNDEDFVYLNGGGIHLVEITPARLGVEFNIKAVPVGGSIDDVDAQAVTIDGRNLRPFAPVNITTSRPVDDITVSWTRRTREVCRLFGPKPLSEAFERYEVEVSPDGGDPVLSVFVDDATTVTITASQLEDVGIYAEDAVDIAVYQIGDIIGRGNPGSGYAAGVTS